MNLLGQGINNFFDLLVWPLAGMPALALIFLSVMTAVAALFIFKIATNQKNLTVARDRLVGHIYEMGLYQDHLSVLARIQGSLARANLRYLALTVPALLALLVPMVITVVQVESRFAHRPLDAGETTIFSVEMKADQAARIFDLDLKLPAGVTIEAGPVRNQPTATVSWKLLVEDPDSDPVRLLLDGQELVARNLRPPGRLPRLNESSGTGFLAPMLAPGVAPLPADGVLSRVTLRFPERDTSYLGLHLNWLVAFCIFSLLGGLLLKDAFKVSL